VEWRAAMLAEYNQLVDMGCWDLVELPPGASCTYCKWVLKAKSVDTGDGVSTHERYKARLTAGGDRQTEGVDFHSTWAPVVSFSVLRLLIAFAATHGYSITQIDYTGAYLNAMLDIPVYMQQPQHMPQQVGPSGQPLVCRLKRALYGLKQSGRLWYLTLRSFMEEEGFKACEMDPCVFIRHTGTSWVLAWVYVDDMGVISNDEEEKERFIEQMGERFEIENKGVLQYYLGINVQHPSEGVVQLDQVKYITELVAEFDLAGSYPAASPISGKPSTDTTELREVMATRYRRMVACLVYVSTMTRPDISLAVSKCSRHLHTPTVADMEAVERVYRYLLWSKSEALTYSLRDPQMHVWTDSDFDGCDETHRSQTALVIMMFGAAMAWKSVRQPVIALSTSEAEYMAQCAGVQELLFYCQLVEELGIQELMQAAGPQVLRADNQGAIKMAQEGCTKTNSRHIQRKFHWIREKVREGFVTLQYVKSHLNVADGLTKGLARQLQAQSVERLLGHRR
jgi:hypothetical protein